VEAHSSGLKRRSNVRIGQNRSEFHTDGAASTAQRRNIEMLEQVQADGFDPLRLIPEFVGACRWSEFWAIWTRAP